MPPSARTMPCSVASRDCSASTPAAASMMASRPRTIAIALTGSERSFTEVTGSLEFLPAARASETAACHTFYGGRAIASRPMRSRVLLRTGELTLGDYACPAGDPLWDEVNDIGARPHVVFPR